MIKRFSQMVIPFFMGCFFLTTQAMAVPMLYTFSATIYEAYDDAGFIEDYGWQVGGDPLFYTILFDFDGVSSKTNADGTVVEFPDDPFYKRFYAEYVSGDLLPTGGYELDPNDPLQLNQASDRWSPIGNDINNHVIRVGSHFASLTMRSPLDIPIVNWVPGQLVAVGQYYALDEAGMSSIFYANMSLVSKEPVGVPEPSILALMGLGLAGIGFVRRKKIA